MQNNRKPIVGITQGDGNGIGYEVIIKALADARILESFTPVIYGSSKIFGFYRKLIHNIEPVDTNVIISASDAHPRRINIVNCLPDNVYVEPGQATAESAKSAIRSLQRAVSDIKNGTIDVLVTAPINKRAMANEGFGYTGHTEYLQKEFGCGDVAMIMISDQLKIGVVTGHIPLKEVPGAITKERILGKLRLMKASLQRDFGIIEPKIAVLGLNPHCGDGGLLGTKSSPSSSRPYSRPSARAFPHSARTPPTDSSAWAISAVSTPPSPCTMTRVWLPSRPFLSSRA